MEDRGVMLITGGSRGIGAATARWAAVEGYPVVVNYCRNAEAARRVVSTIREAGGVACAIQGDVAQEGDVLGLFDHIDRHFGPLAGLVNCAGIAGNRSAVAEFKTERLDRLLAVNVMGTMLCCREAVRRMSARLGGQGGTIVNVSSMAATTGGRAGASDYAASKAAVDAFTMGLAKEVGAEGIRVNAVRPGMTFTDMSDDLRRDTARLAHIAATIPMNRVASPDEIARPIVWLFSEAASFISGACLDVSGGGFIIGAPLKS
jgi:NAD(P)-dependent dehydrogenase (short-subunit alcohol dehydrogenase family)